MPELMRGQTGCGLLIGSAGNGIRNYMIGAVSYVPSAGTASVIKTEKMEINNVIFMPNTTE